MMPHVAAAPASTLLLPPLGSPQDFNAPADRARLTRVALAAYVGLARRWALSNVEAASLLGVSPSSWDRIKRTGTAAPLGQDQMTRVSALVGTYKALHLLFAPDAHGDMADRWPRLTNTGRLFDGQTPIAAMIAGGIPRMIEVRRFIDAVRGGL